MDEFSQENEEVGFKRMTFSVFGQRKNGTSFYYGTFPTLEEAREVRDMHKKDPGTRYVTLRRTTTENIE